MPPADLPSPSCLYMAALIALLGELPTGQDRRRPARVAERLEALEREARAHGAPETTLTAIQGARVLAGMAELPPEPRPDAP